MSEETPNAIEQDKDTRKLSRELARTEWQHRAGTTSKLMDYAIQFGVAALRAPALINAAAIAALLGFVSANIPRLGEGETISEHAYCSSWSV
jgi:hypothetical protein